MSLFSEDVIKLMAQQGETNSLPRRLAEKSSKFDRFFKQLNQIWEMLPLEMKSEAARRLITNGHESNFRGKIAELYSYDFLKTIFSSVLPTVDSAGRTPDFKCHTKDGDLICEVNTIGLDFITRNDRRGLLVIQDLLREIESRHDIILHGGIMMGEPELAVEFKDAIAQLLSEPKAVVTDTEGRYAVHEGGWHILFSLVERDKVAKVTVSHVGQAIWGDPQAEMSAKRAVKKLKKYNYPFFLLSHFENEFQMDDDTPLEVLFGKEQFSVDIKTGKVVGFKYDGSGLWGHKFEDRDLAKNLIAFLTCVHSWDEGVPKLKIQLFLNPACRSLYSSYFSPLVDVVKFLENGGLLKDAPTHTHNLPNVQ